MSLYDENYGTAPVLQDISRQRKLADRLRAQGDEAVNGQMVSGIYVAPSWSQYLAKGLKSYMAGSAERDADKKEKDYTDKRMSYAQKLAAALSPKTEQIPQDYNESGNQPMLPQETTKQPTPQEISAAVNDYYVNTGNSDEIAKNALSGLSKHEEWGDTPRYDQNGKAYLVSKTGNMKYLDGVGQAPDQMIAPNGQVINSHDMSNLGKNLGKAEIVNGMVIGNPSLLEKGTVIPQQTDFNKPFDVNTGEANIPYQNYAKTTAKAGASNTQAITNVNAFEPFANKVQGNMGEKLVTNYETLQNVPTTIKALEAAKASLKHAKNFVGSGGETKLALAKFFNNNLGTSIDPKGVASVEALRSELFYNVMDNLKKMDASPSQQQQEIMQSAFGRIGTDPSALPLIMDFYKGQLQSKVQDHNKRVDQAGQNIKFPYDIHVNMPVDNVHSSSSSGAKVVDFGSLK